MTAIYLYWASTALLSLLYLASAATYIVRRAWVGQVLAGLGYPRYLQSMLIVAKVLAVFAIISHHNAALTDLAYAGMLYHLLLACAAHWGAGKPRGAIPATLGLLLLIASFATQNAARELLSPYAAQLAQQHSTVLQGD